jgi:hypothetical protein
MTYAQDFKRLLLSVFLATLAGMAASADGQKSKLSQRPSVANPKCSDPKPYDIESWKPGVNKFQISFAVVRDDETADDLPAAFRETKRLSEKYKFEDMGPLPDFKLHNYITWVDWLEPEQVAALRCEESVVKIVFTTTHALPSGPGRVVLPNNSLQLP